MLRIENLLPLFEVTGEVNLFEGPSTDAVPNAAPVEIIQDDQTMEVRFAWSQEGPLGFILDDDCKWILRAFFEQMGSGETPADPTPVEVDYVRNGSAEYIESIDVSGLAEGLYRVTVSLTLQSPDGVLTPIAAHEDLGHIQVYSDFTP